MFSALSSRATIALFHLAIHTSNIVTATQHVQVLSFTIPKVLGLVQTSSATAPPGTPAANCTDGFMTQIVGGITSIVGVLMGLGITIAIIGIIIGGLMRATSFGNERRIAMSNTAITCAVVGLVIVLVGANAGNALPGWFGIAPGKCSVTTP